MAIDKAVEIAGAGHYPSKHVNKKLKKVIETAEIYEPADAADWNNDAPTSITEALDRIAAALGPIA